MSERRVVNVVSILLGLLCLTVGGFVAYASVWEMLFARNVAWFDVVAGALFGLIITLCGLVLTFYQAGMEIDDAARVVRQWHRWRGRPKRVVETSFSTFSNLRLAWSPGARFSPGRWQILAARPGAAAVVLGYEFELQAAWALAEELSCRTGIRFPEGVTYWTGTRNGVYCDVSLGAIGLTVGEYTDNPHDFNHSLTAPLTEFLTEQNQGTVAREIIRERLGESTLTEVVEAARLRSRMETEKAKR